MSLLTKNINMDNVDAFGKTYKVDYIVDEVNELLVAIPGGLTAYQGKGKTQREAYGYMYARLNPGNKADVNLT